MLPCSCGQISESPPTTKVLADYETPPADIYAVYLERLNLSAKVAYFVEYLRDYLSRHADSPNQHSSNW